MPNIQKVSFKQLIYRAVGSLAGASLRRIRIHEGKTHLHVKKNTALEVHFLSRQFVFLRFIRVIVLFPLSANLDLNNL